MPASRRWWTVEALMCFMAAPPGTSYCHLQRHDRGQQSCTKSHSQKCISSTDQCVKNNQSTVHSPPTDAAARRAKPAPDPCRTCQLSERLRLTTPSGYSSLLPVCGQETLARPLSKRLGSGGRKRLLPVVVRREALTTMLWLMVGGVEPASGAKAGY